MNLSYGAWNTNDETSWPLQYPCRTGAVVKFSLPQGHQPQTKDDDGKWCPLCLEEGKYTWIYPEFHYCKKHSGHKPPRAVLGYEEPKYRWVLKNGQALKVAR